MQTGAALIARATFSGDAGNSVPYVQVAKGTKRAATERCDLHESMGSSGSNHRRVSAKTSTNWTSWPTWVPAFAPTPLSSIEALPPVRQLRLRVFALRGGGRCTATQWPPGTGRRYEHHVWCLPATVSTVVRSVGAGFRKGGSDLQVTLPPMRGCNHKTPSVSEIPPQTAA